MLLEIYWRLFFYAGVTFNNAEILRLPECNKYAAAFTILYKNYILLGKHSLVPITQYNQCHITCVQYPKCKSISISDNGTMCMLHHERYGENEAVLEPQAGWTHLETDIGENFGPTCTALKPCNYGSCIDDCSLKGYQCHCKASTWRKLGELCYGAMDSSYGVFTIPYNGILKGLKLEHVNGSVKCSWKSPPSIWGCGHPDLVNYIGVLITDESDKVIIPKSGTGNYYSLFGFIGNSSFLEYTGYNIPVKEVQNFRIWFVEDYRYQSGHQYEIDNSGQTCARVLVNICDE